MENNSDTSILIVDDDQVLRESTIGVLEDLGFSDVREASGSHDALHQLRAREFGFVLCDWLMMNGDGRELLMAMGADPNLRHIPVIIMTGDGREEDRIDAEKASADGFLFKPFGYDALEEVITKVLSTRIELPRNDIRPNEEAGVVESRVCALK